MKGRPLLPKSPTNRDCIRHVQRLVRWIGPGFHPDTEFQEYVDEEGERLFDCATCAALEADLSRAWATLDAAGIGIYAVAAPVQRRMLRAAQTTPKPQERPVSRQGCG